MGYGAGVVYTVSMASGSTLSSAITFTRAWDSMLLEIPTMTSGTDVYLKGSTDGTTYRRIYHEPTIANAAPGAVYVTSAVTNCIVELTQGYYPYLKVELSTAMTATPATFKVIAKG